MLRDSTQTILTRLKHLITDAGSVLTACGDRGWFKNNKNKAMDFQRALSQSLTPLTRKNEEMLLIQLRAFFPKTDADRANHPTGSAKFKILLTLASQALEKKHIALINAHFLQNRKHPLERVAQPSEGDSSISHFRQSPSR